MSNQYKSMTSKHVYLSLVPIFNPKPRYALSLTLTRICKLNIEVFIISKEHVIYTLFIQQLYFKDRIRKKKSNFI